MKKIHFLVLESYAFSAEYDKCDDRDILRESRKPRETKPKSSFFSQQRRSQRYEAEPKGSV